MEDDENEFKFEDPTIKYNRGINDLEVEKQSKSLDFPTLDCLKETDEGKLFEYLNEFSEEALSALLEEVNRAIASLIKENYLYEFLLKEDKSIQNTLEMIQVENGSSSEYRKTLLSYPAKCYFATRGLKQLEKNFVQERSAFSNDTQDLRFQLESLNLSLKDLKKANEHFDGKVRVGGRHAVTKKVIMQKVAKFFDDSIKKKMTLTNKYKMQIQNNMMERNKLLSQIQEQEKRLASLDLLKYQEAKFQHENSCKSLLSHKNQLSKCKSKYSIVSHSVVEIKKSLDKGQLSMQQIQETVSKKENMKNVIISEKSRNDQNIKELNAAMRKIKLDPRRHDLPEVVEYAMVKRENAALKKKIKQWKRKIAVAEQAKHMHLSALRKKSQDR